MPLSTPISTSVRPGTTRSAWWRTGGSPADAARVACCALPQNRPIRSLVRFLIAARLRLLPSYDVSGQLPIALDDNTRCVEGGVEAQLRQVMANLQTVVSGCGGDWRRIAMARIYLTHFERDYPLMNAAWEDYFPAGALPARTTIGVSGLALGALIEVDLVVAF